MKKLALIILAVCFMSSAAMAKKSRYIYNDNHMNFVKVEEMDDKEAKEKAPTHPANIAEDKLRNILKEIKLSRSFIVKKDVDELDVFGEHAIMFLLPKLIEAFEAATPKDKVVVSYLEKNPIVILRNDRLTIADFWVVNNELHVEFGKLRAMLTGDYDKRGDYSKIVARAKGLRVALDLRDGQKFGKNTNELVIDMDHDFSKPANTKPVEAVKAEAPAVVPEAKPTDTKGRLKELKGMKEDGLITDKEYKEKKTEILKGL